MWSPFSKESRVIVWGKRMFLFWVQSSISLLQVNMAFTQVNNSIYLIFFHISHRLQRNSVPAYGPTDAVIRRLSVQFDPTATFQAVPGPRPCPCLVPCLQHREWAAPLLHCSLLHVAITRVSSVSWDKEKYITARVFAFSACSVFSALVEQDLENPCVMDC